MEIKDRFKIVRRTLDKNGKKCSQADFGAKFGLSRDAVANIENGRVAPSELFIKAVCEKMNIREEWLREGLDPMIEQVPKEEVLEMVANVLRSGNKMKEAIIRITCTMTDEEIELLNKIVRGICENS